MPADLDLLVRFEDEALVGRTPYAARAASGAVLRFTEWLQPRSVLEATTNDVALWADSLELTRKRVAAYLYGLHTFFNWALNVALVDRDPVAPLTARRQPVNAGEFPELLRGWVVAQERRSLARTTIDKRIATLRMLYDYVAPQSILELDAQAIEQWLDTRRYRGTGLRSPKSRYVEISHLAAFYRWARRQGIVETDPTADIERPRLPVAIPRPISDDDLARALARADTLIKAILAMAAFCGLRAKEIAGLRREDLASRRTESRARRLASGSISLTARRPVSSAARHTTKRPANELESEKLGYRRLCSRAGRERRTSATYAEASRRAMSAGPPVGHIATRRIERRGPRSDRRRGTGRLADTRCTADAARRPAICVCSPGGIIRGTTRVSVEAVSPQVRRSKCRRLEA